MLCHCDSQIEHGSARIFFICLGKEEESKQPGIVTQRGWQEVQPISTEKGRSEMRSMTGEEGERYES